KGSEGLRVGRRVNPDNYDLFGSLVDRLAECGKLCRRDNDSRRFFRYSVLKNRDLAVDVGFGPGTQLRHIDTQVLTGLAGAGEHDLPEEGGSVLNNDRNGRFCDIRTTERG